MQVELDIDELNEVLQALDEHSEDYVLIERLAGILREAQELESLDFDDCAGGACKL